MYLTNFNRIIKLTTGAIALFAPVIVLIALPALLFGSLRQWQIIFVISVYLCFFLATIWRRLKFGQLASRKEDKQVKTNLGRILLIFTAVGLVTGHWLAIYEFFHLQLIGLKWLEFTSTTIGVLLMLAAIVVNQSAVITLGRFFDRLVIKPEHQLIQSGLYSSVRHPIYTSYIMLFMGFCLCLTSLISLVGLLIVCSIWFDRRIKIEEEMLVDEFGQDYQIYQQQTKKLFPYVY